MKSHIKNTKTKKSKKQVLRKNKKHQTIIKKKQYGGAVNANIPECNNPVWRTRFITLVRLLDIDGATPLQIYGTSLPLNSIQYQIDTLLYYMYRKQIRRVMSLQACPDPMCPTMNYQNCPHSRIIGLPSDLEDQTWNNIKNSIPGVPPPQQPTNRGDNEFQPVINNLITDMTSGSLTAWMLFSKYNVHIESERLILHCLAGFGRTGSILLYFLLTRFTRFHASYAEPWRVYGTPWWGLGSSMAMVEQLRTIMTNYIILESDDNLTIDAKIKLCDINRIQEEVLKIGKLRPSTLFISRLNYIILMLAYRNNIPIGTNIVLYLVPTAWPIPPVIELNEDTILSNHVKFLFQGWEHINTYAGSPNGFGITTLFTSLGSSSSSSSSRSWVLSGLVQSSNSTSSSSSRRRGRPPSLLGPPIRRNNVSS